MNASFSGTGLYPHAYNPSVNSRTACSRLALQTRDVRRIETDYRVNWGDSWGTLGFGVARDIAAVRVVLADHLESWRLSPVRNVTPNSNARCCLARPPKMAKRQSLHSPRATVLPH